VCSERFRINAQKKSLDVWLKYRCEYCEGVWKLPLFERRPVSELASALDGFARHDPAMVWKYAFDIPRLRPHVIKIDTDVPVQIARTPLVELSASTCIDFEVPFACDIRLDRLLSRELGIARGTLQEWFESGRLQVWPGQRGALSKRVRDGMRVALKPDLQAVEE
jgi:hypothetical protein